MLRVREIIEKIGKCLDTWGENTSVAWIDAEGEGTIGFLITKDVKTVQFLADMWAKGFDKAEREISG